MNVAERLAARLPVLGDRVDRSPVVAVVKLHGVITPTQSPLNRGSISLGTVESALTRAFGHDRLVAVALSINSPGGAPTQSALVADRIRELAESKNVPVLAFCEDVTASGGYWLACAADEIYAHSTSMVGSIGVVTSSFGLNRLLQRIGVERRLHAVGEHKVRLDPFSEEKPEDVAWLTGIQAALHDQFVGWVRERRGSKLSDTTADLFSGEIWLGAKAAELGLTDGVGTLRQVVTKRWPGAEIVVSEPKKSLLARLGLGGPAARLGAGGPAASVLAALESLEHKAIWSRFGL